MPSETHRLLLTARAITRGTIEAPPVQAELFADPDGPLVPMLPREYWDGTADADAEAGRAMLARDAALIAALRWT